MEKNILVITSCTGEKIHKPEKQLYIYDFLDEAHLKLREIELGEFLTEAGKMYSGSQHISLMEGIKQFRKAGRKLFHLRMIKNLFFLQGNPVSLEWTVHPILRKTFILCKCK